METIWLSELRHFTFPSLTEMVSHTWALVQNKEKKAVAILDPTVFP